MTTTLKPVNIENLEQLLNGIWSGRLPHKQESYFCETSCCVAGWDIALNLLPTKTLTPEECFVLEEQVDREEELEYTDITDKEMCRLLEQNWREVSEAFTKPWEWSKHHNNLTDAEAVLIFSVDSTKPLQKAVIKAFREGKRCTTDSFPLARTDSSNSCFASEEEYYEKNRYFRVPKAAKEELDQFLAGSCIRFR